MSDSHSDALVIFGAANGLAHKIFPALQAMQKHGSLNVPVIGVDHAPWTPEEFGARVQDSLERHGGLDFGAFDQLAGLLRYVPGEFHDPATYKSLHKELDGARRPAYYMAIAPSMIPAVVEQLAKSGGARNARILVEKPFGACLNSACATNRSLLAAFPEQSIFRIDHAANILPEPFWNRSYLESVQVTLAEAYGVEGRGAEYDRTGALREAVPHLFHLISNLAAEPQEGMDCEAIRDARVRVLKAIPAIDPSELVRGQFRGYRHEEGVAPGSNTETFAALRLEIHSPRWQGVPIFVRTGKCLPVTCTELLFRLRKAPAVSSADLTDNQLRFRVSPYCAISGVPRDETTEAYERIFTDALAGNAANFARADYVEEAWRIVDHVLNAGTAAYEYAPGAWGPAEAAQRVMPAGGWHNPAAARSPFSGVEAA